MPVRTNHLHTHFKDVLVHHRLGVAIVNAGLIDIKEFFFLWQFGLCKYCAIEPCHPNGMVAWKFVSNGDCWLRWSIAVLSMRL